MHTPYQTRPAGLFLLLFLPLLLHAGATAQTSATGGFEPVTEQMLLQPGADDWLMYSRTYDAQRFSPLKQIHRGNVAALRQAWMRKVHAGVQESIPLAYNGVLYLLVPPAGVMALDGATGDPIWEHQRPTGVSRSKALAIYRDMIYYTAPDDYLVALDARTGEVRWQAPVIGAASAAPVVIAGKVITGRSCWGGNQECYIAAHDALTGKEIWRFYTAARTGEPGGDTWADRPDGQRIASTWGLPGTYDPQRRLIYWGIANPTPYTRLERYGGDENRIPTHAPAELFSNSTVALDPDTGAMVWYYQHNPGDDWDLDYPHERMLIRTAVSPDPGSVKWINPGIPRDSVRDIAVMVGEGGGIWALDRADGRFLWATPFPFDVPNFLIDHIEEQTGVVHINTDLIARRPQHHHVICFWNTRGYWPTAYHPGENALYVPYADNCLDMTSAGPGGTPPERRVGSVRRPDHMEEFAGLAKINMSSGRIEHIYTGSAPGNGAVLATAGDLIFWGDLDKQMRAFDAASGEILWQTRLGGPVQNSTITYAVNGRQYLAVLTGVGIVSSLLMEQAGLTPDRESNAVYVFALPQGE